MAILEILARDGSVTNTILANEAFAQHHYPDAWRMAPIQGTHAEAPGTDQLPPEAQDLPPEHP
jgi:hypothetical protein